MTFIERLKEHRLIGILRGIEFDELTVLAESCATAGLEFVEITMNTSHAADKIRKLRALSRDRFEVGAGTVLTASQFHEARSAGASFIVSPVLVPEVAQAAREHAMPYVPGALTPQDVYACHLASAHIVKIFPIQCFGPSYVRELKGPFDQIPLLACGGIRPDNIREYLDSGAEAVAIGGSTFKREWLRDKNQGALEESLSALTSLAKRKS